MILALGMPILSTIFGWGGGTYSGKISGPPLMAMVIDRSARGCLMTLAMARPVRSWTLWATAAC